MLLHLAQVLLHVAKLWLQAVIGAAARCAGGAARCRGAVARCRWSRCTLRRTVRTMQWSGCTFLLSSRTFLRTAATLLRSVRTLRHTVCTLLRTGASCGGGATTCGRASPGSAGVPPGKVLQLSKNNTPQSRCGTRAIEEEGRVVRGRPSVDNRPCAVRRFAERAPGRLLSAARETTPTRLDHKAIRNLLSGLSLSGLQATTGGRSP